VKNFRTSSLSNILSMQISTERRYFFFKIILIRASSIDITGINKNTVINGPPGYQGVASPKLTVLVKLGTCIMLGF